MQRLRVSRLRHLQFGVSGGCLAPLMLVVAQLAQLCEKKHDTTLIITVMTSFLVGGVFGYMIRSKVEPKGSPTLARLADLGFDWYLGSNLIRGADISASNILTKAMAKDVSK